MEDRLANVTQDANFFNSMNSTQLIATQEIQGRSLFWAMVALALGAMTQPSTVTGLLFGNLFEGDLDPLRCSPITCAIDTVLEAGMVLTMWNLRWQGETNLPPVVNAVAPIRLVVFVLGILPQALKVFSMSGVPITQVSAAAFLSAIVVRALGKFSGLQYSKDLAACEGLLGGPHHHDEPLDNNIKRTVRTMAPLIILLLCAAFLGQVVALEWTWVLAACSMNFWYLDRSSIFADVFQTIRLLWLIYALLYFLFCLVESCRGLLRDTKRENRLLHSLVPGWTLSFMFLVAIQGTRQTQKTERTSLDEVRRSIDTFSKGTSLCIAAALASLFLAYLLGEAFVSKTIDHRCEDCPASLGPGTGSVNGGSTAHNAGQTSNPSGRRGLRQPCAALIRWVRDDSHIESALPPTGNVHEADATEPFRITPPEPARQRSKDVRMLTYLFFPLIATKKVVSCFERTSKATYCIAFSLHMLITAAMYYLIAFDGHGTFNPNWTAVLG